MRRLEAHMMAPLHEFMVSVLKLDVVAREFSAGYGIADLVGAWHNYEGQASRQQLGIGRPLDNRLLIETLLALHPHRRTSLATIIGRIPISESTLRKRVLPQLAAIGLVERYSDDFVRLVHDLPMPTRGIVAIEAKQTKWRDAILQARRYSFFADQSYVAVWNGTARLVDRVLLYRHRLGLIGVEPEGATILVPAPRMRPRDSNMNRYCAEFLYGKASSAEDPADVFDEAHDSTLHWVVA